MERCESPDSPFAFQDFELHNDCEGEEFFFPSEDLNELPFSPPFSCYDESNLSHTSSSTRFCPEDLAQIQSNDFALSKAQTTNSGSDCLEILPSKKTKQTELNGSAFSSYILSGVPQIPPKSENAHSAAMYHHDPQQQVVGGTAAPQANQNHDSSKKKLRSAHQPGNSPQNKHVQPCVRCHFLKLKCDGEMPCWRCVRKGIGPECCRPPPQQAEYVDAPVSWRRDGYIQPGTVVNDAFIGPQKSRVVQFISEMLGKKVAVSPPWIDSILSNITPKLSESLTEMFGKLLATDPMMAKMNPATMAKKGSAAAFDLYPSVAFFRQRFDWHQMTLEVEINRTLARCVGAHPEEILERVTRNDMPNTSTDFDMLCTVLDDLPLILGGLPNGTSWSQRFFFYTVINPKTGQILVLIFRCTIKACYDDQARLKTLEKWMQPATPDEYDITSEKTPELCRPLQAAVGDRRKGAEIIAMLMAERSCETITTGVVRSGALKQKIDNLAEVIRERYSPIIENVVKKRKEAAAAKLSVLVP